MCFAIPISDALPIIQSIINGTQQTLADGNAYMGIQGKDLSAYDAASFNMPQGVYVLAAVENGPAYQAGLQSGDVITALNGTTVSSMSEIKSILAQLNPGDVITVTVARSDQGGNYAEQDITVTLGSYSE
jgi:serine protease Do